MSAMATTGSSSHFPEVYKLQITQDAQMLSTGNLHKQLKINSGESKGSRTDLFCSGKKKEYNISFTCGYFKTINYP